MKTGASRLINWTKRRFLIEDIPFKWSGQVMEPVGSPAFIGLNPICNKNKGNENSNNAFICPAI
ncbi:MAG TPA: hypothetical protein VFG45_05270 [Candidatus Nitrosocosmicus sp.]|nr:hypothetical protein [Candidatus Nitrosocosmicus sp.]